MESIGSLALSSVFAARGAEALLRTARGTRIHRRRDPRIRHAV